MVLESESPPWSAASNGCFSISRFSDDSSEDYDYPSSALKSAFDDDWDDFPPSYAEVTLEDDGSQLIHIPYHSPFFSSPAHSNNAASSSNPRRTFSPLSAASSSCSSCSMSPYWLPSSLEVASRRESTIHISTDRETDEATRQFGAEGTTLFLGTTFLPSKPAVSPALPSSPCWRSPRHVQTYPLSSFVWGSEEEDDPSLDVPCNAVSLEGMANVWDEILGMLLPDFALGHLADRRPKSLKQTHATLSFSNLHQHETKNPYPRFPHEPVL